ncbi:MAG TPA: hypothetical protein V6C97_27970 [Oculatellaceae cyanobacterium]
MKPKQGRLVAEAFASAVSVSHDYDSAFSLLSDDLKRAGTSELLAQLCPENLNISGFTIQKYEILPLQYMIKYVLLSNERKPKTNYLISVDCKNDSLKICNYKVF